MGSTAIVFFFRLKTNVCSNYGICKECHQRIEKHSIVLATIKEIWPYHKELRLYHKDCGLIILDKMKKEQSRILATLNNSLINIRDGKAAHSLFITFENIVQCTKCGSFIEPKKPMYHFLPSFLHCQACTIKELQKKMVRHQAEINCIQRLISELNLNLIPSLKLRQLKTYNGGGQELELV